MINPHPLEQRTLSTPSLTGTHRQSSGSDDSNMIPLINIVFLMLIFFMVAGKIAARDAADFSPPETAIATNTPREAMTVIVAKDGFVWIDNQIQMHISALTDEQWQATSQQLSDASQVMIKADAQLPATQLNPLLTALRASDIQQVQLAVQALP